jgi:threonine/homoserine/homoserine lactone efflux protein
VSHVAAFLAVSALVIATPGQDTALTIRNTLLGRRRSGVFTAIGVAAGQACWTVAASAGAVALLRASAPAFETVKLAGSAYLVFLGAQALCDAFLRRRAPGTGGPSGRRVSSATSFRQGLLSNLGNPKMAIFFTSLLPQFGSSFPSLLALGLLFCSLTLVWLTGYAFAVAKAGNVLRRPRIRRALDAITGTVLVAFGLRLAAERS